jgi:D-alanine-D-alanine ligase
MRFRNVAVLMGGPSAEHAVSLRSGAAVARGLREAGYSVTECACSEAALALPPGVEAVFIALHGTFGEDGGVQALLDARGMPYTGSGAAASRRAFDKALAKPILSAHGIPTPEYEILRNGAAPRLTPPLVVKPAQQGSTLGVHCVRDRAAWDAARRDAARYGAELIVERFLPGREFTVGIVGTDVLPVVEIVAPDGWYSYGAKYTPGQTRYCVPAPIDAALDALCRDLARRTFTALGCRGLGRVDVRCDAAGRPFVLELNTIPGFTETSLLPKAAAAAGMAFPELCGRIMESAAAGGDDAEREGHAV